MELVVCRYYRKEGTAAVYHYGSDGRLHRVPDWQTLEYLGNPPVYYIDQETLDATARGADISSVLEKPTPPPPEPTPPPPEAMTLVEERYYRVPGTTTVYYLLYDKVLWIIPNWQTLANLGNPPVYDIDQATLDTCSIERLVEGRYYRNREDGRIWCFEAGKIRWVVDTYTFEQLGSPAVYDMPAILLKVPRGEDIKISPAPPPLPPPPEPPRALGPMRTGLVGIGTGYAGSIQVRDYRAILDELSELGINAGRLAGLSAERPISESQLDKLYDAVSYARGKGIIMNTTSLGKRSPPADWPAQAARITQIYNKLRGLDNIIWETGNELTQGYEYEWRIINKLRELGAREILSSTFKDRERIKPYVDYFSYHDTCGAGAVNKEMGAGTVYDTDGCSLSTLTPSVLYEAARKALQRGSHFFFDEGMNRDGILNVARIQAMVAAQEILTPKTIVCPVCASTLELKVSSVEANNIPQICPICGEAVGTGYTLSIITELPWPTYTRKTLTCSKCGAGLELLISSLSSENLSQVCPICGAPAD